MSRTDRYINEMDQYGAHNYHPLPVVISKGKGIWVWDIEGKKYLDMLSSYSALNQGHCHPELVKTVLHQMKQLTLTSRAFHNDKLGPFLKKLAKLVKKEKILPMNTGAEAVETALKAARKWGHKVKGVPNDRAEIIACSNNFHGRTITIISMSTEDQYRDGFGPLTPGFKLVPYGNVKALDKTITKNTVAFLVEPIQGEGGVIVPPEGYLKECYDVCKKNNVLFIADEIQTGIGRTGKFLACEHEDVIADIYTLGKALSGGFYPISAIAADDDIMQVFTPGDHGSTFGGNPLAAAIGDTALDIIVKDSLVENAKKTGRYFMDNLKKMKSPHIKEIRGKGLLIGVELYESSGPARVFCERLMQEGLLAKDTHSQVIRFAPPLIITTSQIDWALKRIKKVLS